MNQRASKARPPKADGPTKRGAPKASRPGASGAQRSGKASARTTSKPAQAASGGRSRERSGAKKSLSGSKKSPSSSKVKAGRELPSVVAEGPQKSGTVALVGRANVGKSTLLNAALGHPLAIVSPTPQTTRDTLLGVLHLGQAELRLLDTPGLHKPKTELGRVMNHHAREAARAADVVVFVTDFRPVKSKDAPPRLAPHPGDLTLLQSLKEAATESGASRKVVLVINKVDLAREKLALLPLIEAFSKVMSFEAIIPISAYNARDAKRAMSAVASLCPEAPWQFGPDDMTDRPTRFFASEYVREQILRATRLEVPHAAAVTIDRFEEPAISLGARGLVEIDVTIHVERPGQKKILVGKGGATLKNIGARARRRMEELLGQRVVLRTWVRVTPAWRASKERLAEMGYQRKQEEEGTWVLAELPEMDEDLALPEVILPEDGEEQDQ